MEVKNNIGNPKNKKKYKYNKTRVFGAIFLLIFSIVFGALASTAVNLLSVYNKNSENKITSLSDLGEVVQDIREMSIPLEEPLNILVLGSDIGYDARGRKSESIPTRSDTLMITRVDPFKKDVGILSIPRDTRILIPGRRYYDKVNAAYAYGGENLAMKTIANFTGATVHRFVSLKVNGLENIVDVLGGVDIYVDQPMVYRDRTAKLDINFQKGWHKLDGHQAHSYVRFRHDAYGDIGRVQRQQKFVQAMVAKLLSPGTVLKIPDLANVILQNIETNLSRREMLKLGYFLKSLAKENVRMVMLPGKFGNIGGVSYWLPETEKALEVIGDLFPDSIYVKKRDPYLVANNSEQVVDAIDKRLYKISVFNGTEESRLAAQVARILKEDGWSVWSVGQSAAKTDKTQLILQTGKTKPLPELKRSIGLPVEVVNASIGDLYTDFTLIVGKDFADQLKARQEALQ